MSVTTTCHSDGFLTFPRECVRCGVEPRTILTVDAGRGIDLLAFSHATITEITVPLCRRCRWNRAGWSFVFGLIIVVAPFAVGFPLIHNARGDTRLMFLTGLLVALGCMFLYMRNWHARFMDRLLAGISAGRLQKDGTFRLWLKRDELAGQLTHQSEPRKYIEAVSYATHNERAHQQLASWKGKCMIAFVLLAAAWFIWRDLTQLEAGEVRQVSLPSILFAIYQLCGKWPTCLTFGIPGLAFLVVGVRQFVNEKIMNV